jgi:1-acyl-sn-glycerol-3-phosphate acyltransferase
MKKNNIFDYIITIVIIIFFPVILFMGVITYLLMVFIPKDRLLFLSLFAKISLPLFGVFVKKNGSLPKEGSYIVVMNHSSFIDYLLVLIVMGYKNKWTIVYGKNLHKYPIFKYFLRKVGIPVNRDSKTSRSEASEIMCKALLDGFSLAIFPEGTRMRSYQFDQLLLPFKNGAFNIASELKIPIIPVVLLRPILYSKPDKPLLFSPRVITINYCEPIVGENTILLRNKTHEIMKDIIKNSP